MKMRKVLSILLTLSLLLSTISMPIRTIRAFSDEELVITEAELKKQDITEDQNVIVKEQLEEETKEAVETYEIIEEIVEETKENQTDSENLAIRSTTNIITWKVLMSNLMVEPFMMASEGYYKVVNANADGTFSTTNTTYTDFKQAKAAMSTSSNANAVVLDNRRTVGNQVVAMKNGVVVTTADKVGKSTLSFTMTGNESISTYVENKIDAVYYDSSGSTVKMGISGQIVDGIKIEEVELVPMIQGIQSYYTKNSNNDLVHSVARYTINATNNRYIGKYESFTICKAPAFMSTGVKYYSIDGEKFYKDNQLKSLSGTFYPYYKYLTFRSKTNYTEAELNKYISSWNRSTSVLNAKGKAFIKAQEDYGVNAAMLLAFAVHESGYGTSKIAREKNNVFGVNATDSNPHGNASTYNSVESAIYNQAEYQISRGYADANTDGRYFGVNLGNKKVGLNVKYASDPYWGEKIAGHIYRMDKFLGNKDDNKYQLAISNKMTFAKDQPNASGKNYYKYAVKNFSLPVGIPILVVKNNNGWYEIQSDMGIDSVGTTPASYKTLYDFNVSKAYVSTSDFDLINQPATKYIDPAKVGTEQEVDDEQKVVDTKPPSIIVKSGSVSLSNNGFSRQDITVSITDESTFTKTITRNGSAITWPSDNKFTVDGVYIITAKDKMNNMSKFTFTIDKTKPKIEVKSTTGTNYTNNQFIKTDAKVTYSDANYLSRAVTHNGKSITWPTDSVFKTDGKYIITIKDKAGNVNTFTFTIDKTKPKIVAKSTTGTNYTNGKFVKTNTKVTYTDANYSSRAVTHNGKSITWPTDSVFKTNGKYIITIKDKAGNVNTFTFTIDKTKPAITVKTTKGFTIKNGQTSVHNVKATYSDANYSSRKVTRNGKSYTWPSQSTFKAKGTYIITVKDKAGNASTFKFIRR
ncbi:N-acetylglucosaminidase [Alkalibaculum sporogenes]|nr:glucosaminidase domain-containing protein [Alkalibaculum sporogenes]